MTGPSPDPELTALKREFDTLREEFSALKERQQARNQELVQTLRAFGLSGEEIEAHVSALMNHGLTRRAALLAVVGAVGGVGFLAGQETARAQAVGNMGVEAEPLTKVWTHEIESGDGATELQITDTVLPDADNTRDLGAAATQWANIFANSVDAGTIATDALTINDIVNSPRVTKTVSSGNIAVSDATYISVDGEGASADNLDTLSGGTDGQIVILEGGNATITVRDGTTGSGDRIFLDGNTDKTLDAQADKLTLIYDDAANQWQQMAFSNNF